MPGHPSARERPPPPATVADLMARAEALSGRTIAEVAEELGERVPADLKRHKGWVGNLVEHALGADAASRDEPDFMALAIELKTIPVDHRGRPLETTFVATVPLDEVGDLPWERSRVRRKLARVLWVPVLGERQVSLSARRIGAPLLWSPSPEQEAALREDWDELAGIIGRGDVESITGRLGRFLQVRPKAANASVRRRAIDADGGLLVTLPRGFYLRTQFTAAILREAFLLPG
ncbi:MAG: DNA mismatch repair endonuclease MutH [Polyangiaceae bacterium]